jgi:hypothetical protein
MHHTSRRRKAATLATGLALSLALGLGSLAAPAGAQSTIPDPEPVCPADEGNARFVRFIYLNILFRCPTEADTAFWTAKLDGGYSRGQFAKYVDLSTENLVYNNVLELYGRLLDREPTQAELDAGVAFIRANQSDGQLIADILASDEFFENYEYDEVQRDGRATEKDEAWLNEVYNFILDRDVDEAGFEYWTGVLGEESTQATRRKVTRSLERAPEATFGWIFGVYFAGLNRPPSDGDIQYWQQWLLGPVGRWRTFHMWTTVLSSAEGYARAQTQPSPEMLTATPEGKVAKRDVNG